MGLRRVRGVRTSLPTNTVVGRSSGGKGAAELIDLGDLARDLQLFGAGASGAPASLPAIGDGHILANLSGSSAVPIDKSLTQLLDYVMGSTRGMILRRGVSGWEALALGSNGKVLQSNGTDAAWATISTAGSIGTDTDVTLSSLADKDLLYYQTSDSKWHNVTFSALLDAVIGSTRGSLAYRGSGGWTARTPGVTNKVLMSAGSGADPLYSQAGAPEWLSACSAATVAVLPACTYANGTAGVGATLTGNVNGALTAQDGITLVAGNRLLVKTQADAKQNGPYIVTQIGTGSTPFILTRDTGWDGSTGDFIVTGAITFVAGGTVNARTAWSVQTVMAGSTYVFGTDTNTWAFVFGTNVITSSTISGSTDASVSGLANNDFFQYQTGDSKWHNRTVTQATASLDAATATLKGLVPTPPNDTTMFLRGDATFATVSSTGGGGSSFAPLELALVAHANVTISGASKPILHASGWSPPGTASCTGYYLSCSHTATSENTWLIFWDTTNSHGYLLDLQGDNNLVWYSVTAAGNVALASGTRGGTGRVLTTTPVGVSLIAGIVAINAATDNSFSGRHHWTEIIFPFRSTTYNFLTGTWELYVSPDSNTTVHHLYQVDLKTNPFMA